MQDIRALLRTLGITSRLKGYRVLASAVELAMEDEDYLYNITKKLCPELAGPYHTTDAAIHQCIRTAIRTCWNSKTGRENLIRIAGYEMDKAPKPTEFLDILVAWLKRHDNNEI